MLEKTGNVVLTDHDFQEYYEGRVSNRVKTEWNLTLDELHEIIRSKNYTFGKPDYHREK